MRLCCCIIKGIQYNINFFNPKTKWVGNKDGIPYIDIDCSAVTVIEDQYF